MKKLILITATSLFLLTPQAQAAAAAAADAAAQPAAAVVAKPAKVAVCAGCHGADGNSLAPTFPKLAGQHAQYIELQLKDFRKGFRKNALMQTFAKNLTDQEISELATYFAAQKQK